MDETGLVRAGAAAFGAVGGHADRMHHDLDVDLEHRRVFAQGAEVRLRPTEWELLKVFLANPDRVLTHRWLLQHVWGPAYGSEGQYLHVYVSGLRKKLEADPRQPRHFLTERGIGYRFRAGPDRFARDRTATSEHTPSPASPPWPRACDKEGAMYELYQAEWCPYSHRVRARLTERGVDFIARQVPAQKSERRAMREKTGADSIPALVADGRVIDGFEKILAFIDERHPPTPDSPRHRAKDHDPEEQHERARLRTEYP